MQSGLYRYFAPDRVHCGWSAAAALKAKAALREAFRIFGMASPA